MGNMRRRDSPRQLNSWSGAPSFARPIASISCPILSIRPFAILRRAGGDPIIKAMRERLTQLCALVERHAVGRRMQTPIPRVIIGVSRERTGILPGLYEPMLCLVLQGAQE